MKNKIALIVVIIFGVIFYWYSYRPNKIKKDCYVYAKEMSASLQKEYGGYYPYEVYYRECLVKNGI